MSAAELGVPGGIATLDEEGHLVAAQQTPSGDWIYPTPDNGWSSIGAGYEFRYKRLSSGLVVIQGGGSGPFNVHIFDDLLPLTMRPDRDEPLMVRNGASSDNTGLILVGADGTVKLVSGEANVIMQFTNSAFPAA